MIALFIEFEKNSCMVDTVTVVLTEYMPLYYQSLSM